MDNTTVLIGMASIIWFIFVLYWMFTVMNLLDKVKYYTYIQTVLSKKLLEKDGEVINIEELYYEARAKS